MKWNHREMDTKWNITPMALCQNRDQTFPMMFTLHNAGKHFGLDFLFFTQQQFLMSKNEKQMIKSYLSFARLDQIDFHV